MQISIKQLIKQRLENDSQSLYVIESYEKELKELSQKTEKLEKEKAFLANELIKLRECDTINKELTIKQKEIKQ